MVDLRKDTRGEGSMKGLNVVIRSFSNSATRDKDTGASKGQFLDVQLDVRDPRAYSTRVNPDTGRKKRFLDNPNLHFSTETVRTPQGPRHQNGVFYHESQVEAIKAQAIADGNYHERGIENADGTPKIDPKTNEQVKEQIFGVKADGTVSTQRKANSPDKVKALILKTDTLSKSDFDVTADALKYQIEGMKEAGVNVKRFQAEAKGKSAEKPATIPPKEGAVQTEAPEAAADEPEFS